MVDQRPRLCQPFNWARLPFEAAICCFATAATVLNFLAAQVYRHISLIAQEPRTLQVSTPLTGLAKRRRSSPHPHSPMSHSLQVLARFRESLISLRQPVSAVELLLS